MAALPRLLALVLAGGKGSRLHPLTRDRAKPAVPFARYRIIDFVLSNLFNSAIRSIYVLTQYKAQSLVEHLQRAWGAYTGPNDFVTIVPAQMRLNESWFRGTADSVFQNHHLIEDFRPDAVLVFGADHVYKMDVSQMVDFHFQKEAAATVACIPIRKEEAGSYGIVQTDADGRIVGFQEKPESDVATIPGDPDHAFASMGNYVFEPHALWNALEANARMQETRHDFGYNIIPKLVESGKVFAYNFNDNRVPGVTAAGEHAYWRDVGTIEAYYDAVLDLKNVVPHFNLYNWDWPIHTSSFPDPPSKLVLDDEQRRGVLLQSILSGGCIISGGYVKDSVLGRNVWIEEGAEVRDCILFDNVHVGKGARLQRAIIDKNVRVAEGDKIGHDLATDALRHHVSERGITVVAKARGSWLNRARDL